MSTRQDPLTRIGRTFHEKLQSVLERILGRYYAPGALLPLWMFLPGLAAGVYLFEPIIISLCCAGLAATAYQIYRNEQRWRA